MGDLVCAGIPSVCLRTLFALWHLQFLRFHKGTQFVLGRLVCAGVLSVGRGTLFVLWYLQCLRFCKGT